MAVPKERPDSSEAAAGGSPVLTVVIPARNEVEGLPPVLVGIARVMADLAISHEILVVDDGSTDGTAKVAAEHGARVLSRPVGMGNGAAVKAGIRAARGEYVVLMDADGQHDPGDLPRMLEPLERGFAMVVGARSGDFGGGWHRALANVVYARLATWVASFPIPDLTSGYRVVRRDVARRFLYLLPNTFSYPTTLTLSLLRCGLPVSFVPIRAARRTGKSKIRLLQDGARFLLIILRVATFFSPLRVFLPASLLAAALGLGYYVQQWWALGVPKFTTGMQLLLLLSALLFALALIAEQVAALRFDRSEVEE